MINPECSVKFVDYQDDENDKMVFIDCAKGNLIEKTQEIEKYILSKLMRYYKGNQTKVSKVYGINRGTLRKKLKLYGML